MVALSAGGIGAYEKELCWWVGFANAGRQLDGVFDSQDIWVFKTMYIEYKNVKCEIYTSSTTELALRYWSYPGHEQIPSNGDDTYYPEHPSIIRTAVAIYQQEHNAAKIAGCASHARDETCDTDQPLVAHIDSTVVSTDSPLDVGCTCGTREKHPPLPASSKKANPVMSPTNVAFEWGFKNPMMSRNTPVMAPKLWTRIFFPHSERVWR